VAVAATPGFAQACRAAFQATLRRIDRRNWGSYLAWRACLKSGRAGGQPAPAGNANFAIRIFFARVGLLWAQGTNMATRA